MRIRVDARPRRRASTCCRCGFPSAAPLSAAPAIRRCSRSTAARSARRCSPAPSRDSARASTKSRARARRRRRAGRATGPATTYEQVTAGERRCATCATTPASTSGRHRRRRRAAVLRRRSRRARALEHVAPARGLERRAGPCLGRQRARVASSSTRPRPTRAASTAASCTRSSTRDARRRHRLVRRSPARAASGDASSPDALRPTVDFFAGSRPDGPSTAARWRSEPALRTAQRRGRGRRARCSARYGREPRARPLHAFLQPKLRPGTVVEMQRCPTAYPAVRSGSTACGTASDRGRRSRPRRLLQRRRRLRSERAARLARRRRGRAADERASRRPDHPRRSPATRSSSANRRRLGVVKSVHGTDGATATTPAPSSCANRPRAAESADRDRR